MFLQVIDEDRDDLITFKQFAHGLGVICRGEFQDVMQFVYRMHIAPAICEETGSHDESENSSVDSCSEVTEGDSHEDLQGSEVTEPVEELAVDTSNR